jgi:hypothetical protein
VLPEIPLGEAILEKTLEPKNTAALLTPSSKEITVDQDLKGTTNDLPLPLISPVNDETGVNILNETDMTEKFDLMINPDIKGIIDSNK